MISAADMQRTLLRYMGASNNQSSTVDARAAIVDALREVWGRHDWPYYQGQQYVRLNAPYETGTIEYDATTRQFTLTSGTWPTWAVYGAVVIGPKRARVTRRISDTIVEVEEGSQFTANIASGATYKLYRMEYPLPTNVRKVAYLTLENSSTVMIRYVPPIEFWQFSPGQTGSVVRYYTITKDRTSQNQSVLVFYPYPNAEQVIRYNYVRMPNPIYVWSETQGKITTNATTAVAGNGSAFTSRMEDCLLRVGSDATNVPTALYDMYPFAEEGIVHTVTNGTTLATENALSLSSTNVKYEISSVLDIDEDIMSSYFTLQCYYELGKRRKMVDKDQIIVARQLEIALKQAKSKSNTNQDVLYAGNNLGGRSYNQLWVVVG